VDFASGTSTQKLNDENELVLISYTRRWQCNDFRAAFMTRHAFISFNTHAIDSQTKTTGVPGIGDRRSDYVGVEVIRGSEIVSVG